MQMTRVENVSQLQQSLVEAAKAGKRVALVPTMGALHAGHIKLVEEAKKLADYVVASVFVNPVQFAPGEDFEKYPRSMDSDLKKLSDAGVSLAYTPSVADIYPPGFTTKVTVGDVGTVLCGKFRPGHFDGVATVVTKLLLRVLPHIAVFGEKDYQQLCIIRQLVSDLDMPMEIVGVPTVRESDGLAMSSRNAYLTAEERKLAPRFYEALTSVAQMITAGTAVEAAMMVGGTKLSSLGFKVDYLDYRQADTLFVLDALEKPSRLLGAVRLGNTRLIDNIAIG